MSIEAQLAELRAIAKNENLPIASEFVEKRTAKMPGRKVFNEMVGRIQKGEAQGIICWKLDRLARNPVDGGQISWMLQQGIVSHIRVHDKHYYSTDNVLMMSVEFGMANQFVRDLSSNVKRGLRAKVKRGEFPSTAPTGYLNDVRRKTIVVARKKAPILKQAFELYAQGESRLEDIADFLFERNVRSLGGRKLHRDRIKWILSNPFYYGHFYYAGEVHEGKHPPLITKKLYDQVQQVMLDRGHPQKAVKNPKVFCGLLKCETCKMGITAEDKAKRCKNGNIHNYVYYHCTRKSKTIECHEPHIREEDLEKQLSEILVKYSLPSPWAEEFRACLAEDEKKAEESSGVIIADLKNRIDTIADKIQRLLDIYLAQDIDRETYLKERAKLLSDKKTIEEKIGQLERDAGAWLEPLQDWIETASTLAETAERNDLPSKKSSLQKIFGSNLTLHAKKILENPAFPYASLRDARQKFSLNDSSCVRAGRFGLGIRV